MKKLLAGFAAAALVLALTAASALAAPYHGRAVGRICNGLQTGWVRPACSFVDNDGDGICDNYGSGNCRHEGCFVDNDGDGVCDNYGTGYGNGNGSGSGWGGGHHGQGHGRHHG